MIIFKPIEKYHLVLLKEWRNSDSVRPYVREYRLLNDSDQDAWYQYYLQSRLRSDWNQEIYMIHEDTIPIGVGGFTRIEWRNRRSELTFYLGNPKFEEYIEDCLINLVEKGFREFNFHKITWPVYGHDPRLELYKGILDVEAILKEEYFWDGKFQDRIYLSKLNVDK